MPIICEPLPRPTFFEQRRIRAIYHANFAPAQRKPFSYLLRSARDGELTFFVARDTAARRRIVSVATLAALNETSALYLGYLATGPAQQSQGIGGQLFDALIAYAAAQPGVDAVVWEVDVPPLDDPAHLDARRIRFYERHGAYVISQARSYRMPDDATGGTVPQRLMWCPARQPASPPAPAPAPPPDRATVAAWIAAIFRDVYIDAGDLAEQMLAELHEDIT